MATRPGRAASRFRFPRWLSPPTSAQRDQESPPAPHYGVNDNATIDQVSLFVAGGVGHVGAFIQATYDGVARAFHWDNLDIRATTDIKVAGKPTVIGVSLNNAPTLTDPFNTLVAWGYPYTTSSVAPSPAAAPLIGGLAQTSLGANAYAWFNSQLYLEAGGYVSPSANFLTRAGVDPHRPWQHQWRRPLSAHRLRQELGAEEPRGRRLRHEG